MTSLEKLEVAPPSPGQLRHGKRRMFVECGSVLVQSVFELLRLPPASAGLSSSLSCGVTENRSDHPQLRYLLHFVSPQPQGVHRSVTGGQNAPTRPCCAEPAANAGFVKPSGDDAAVPRGRFCV